MRNLMSGIILVIQFLLLIFVSACSHMQGMSALSSKTAILSAENLTREMAEKRFRLISKVRYNLNLDVSDEGEVYRGEQTITFDLNSLEDIYFDFQGGSIQSAVVNGKAVNLERGKIFVRLPKESLKLNENSVRIQFTHEYSHSGEGLHRFVDPEDKKVYLYTQFEPFDANRFAPFFDQPDLKAILNLTVRAPSKWEVVGNTKAVSHKLLSADVSAYKINAKEWVFAPTVPLSTYLFVVVAGPYVHWESRYKNIPLRLFARKSIAKYVPHKEWFLITKQGLGFYEKYFDFKYPFGKYDQLIVPEFNAGAMENAGAVTFSEKYIRRSNYTLLERSRLANVVLHEMAHMWFGDLVTMKWWNDLWLNESFATYMSSLAQVSATSFKEAGMHLHNEKLDAYKQDQMMTTHPISSNVQNTNEAFSSFDDITYGKGASVMKELSYYIGADQFRLALQHYFKKFKYSNTTLNDFISAFEFQTKSNMQSWFSVWLETTNVDTVAQSFICKAGSLDVSLNFSAHSRPHAFKVGGYKMINGKLKEVADIKVHTDVVDRSGDYEYTTSSKVNVCPDFIYANVGDHGYFKLQFDDQSLNFLKGHIQDVADADLRYQIWSDIWQMIRDQKFKLTDFAKMVASSLVREKDVYVLNYLTSKTTSVGPSEFDTVFYYWPRTTEAERTSLDLVKKQFESLFYNQMQVTKGDIKLLFLDAYLNSEHTQDTQKNILSLLKKLKDPDRRWKALNSLCRSDYAKSEKLISNELNSDKSDVAIKNALACRVSRPSDKVKADYIQKMTTDKTSFSASEIAQITANLFPSEQRGLMAKYSDELNDSLLHIWPKWQETYQNDLAYGLTPVYCDMKGNQKVENLISEQKLMPSTLKTPILTKYDDDKRCIAIRKYNSLVK